MLRARPSWPPCFASFGRGFGRAVAPRAAQVLFLQHHLLPLCPLLLGGQHLLPSPQPVRRLRPKSHWPIQHPGVWMALKFEVVALLLAFGNGGVVIDLKAQLVVGSRGPLLGSFGGLFCRKRWSSSSRHCHSLVCSVGIFLAERGCGCARVYMNRGLYKFCCCLCRAFNCCWLYTDKAHICGGWRIADAGLRGMPD